MPPAVSWGSVRPGEGGSGPKGKAKLNGSQVATVCRAWLQGHPLPGVFPPPSQAHPPCGGLVMPQGLASPGLPDTGGRPTGASPALAGMFDEILIKKLKGPNSSKTGSQHPGQECRLWPSQPLKFCDFLPGAWPGRQCRVSVHQALLGHWLGSAAVARQAGAGTPGL